MNELEALLTRRKSLYEMADERVDTADKPPAAVVERVVSLVRDKALAR
jgi:shikimate kinase